MNVIDRSRYDVALMIVSPRGAFMELLPDDLRIISNPTWAFLTGRLSGSWGLLKSGHPLLAIGNTIRLGVSLFSKAAAGRMIAAMMPPLTEEFDAVVDFNGQQQLYYMVDKIKAKKKITFFHSDYSKWPYYYSADKKYLPKVDNIFTISELCVESMKKYFPEVADKIGLMENISSKALIEKMSTAEAPEIDGKIATLLTVGHVCENKGILWAIDAAKILKSRNLHFRWYFIGTVDKPAQYSALIEKKGLNENIVFLGIKTNPYAYMRKATMVVHPSKFEGRSIALDEAKLLSKPVVATNFSTVTDQFKDRHNASICQMNPESIADAVEELITDEDLRNKYITNLKSEARDNSSEINKLYTIFDD